MATFLPRLTFPTSTSLPRSYYLGHHASGLSRMKSLLSTIDLVIECRDYRLPLTSRNPTFESTLGTRPRLIVYTQQDLGSHYSGLDTAREAIVSRWFAPTPVLFTSSSSKRGLQGVLGFCRDHANDSPTAHLFGTRVLVVGMPNVGKSTLLNSLRKIGLNRGKASRTGRQPGVTRRIESAVKIIESKDADEGAQGEAGSVYVVDTPGVFVTYAPDAESMLKLCLCGSVKDTIVPPTTVADYLLFHLNLQDPTLYASFHSEPTNDIGAVLRGLATKQGRLKKGGEPDYDAAALQFIQRWRAGEMGRFVLDEVTEGALQERESLLEGLGGSLNQARKEGKAKRVAAMGRS